MVSILETLQGQGPLTEDWWRLALGPMGLQEGQVLPP